MMIYRLCSHDTLPSYPVCQFGPHPPPAVLPVAFMVILSFMSDFLTSVIVGLSHGAMGSPGTGICAWHIVGAQCVRLTWAELPTISDLTSPSTWLPVGGWHPLVTAADTARLAICRRGSWSPSWCWTSCAATASWRASASVARASPTASSSRSSGNGEPCGPWGGVWVWSHCACIRSPPLPLRICGGSRPVPLMCWALAFSSVTRESGTPLSAPPPREAQSALLPSACCNLHFSKNAVE